MAGLDLGKQVGPLPLGAWLVVVGTGVGIAVFGKRNSGPPAPPEIVEDIGGVPGVGMGPGWVAVPPPSFAPATPQITTNDEWAIAATNYLIAQGYDPGVSDQAVRKYISAERLGIQEYSLIRIVLTKIGALPYPLPPGPDAPVVVPAQPAVPAAPAPTVAAPVVSIPRPGMTIDQQILAGGNPQALLDRIRAIFVNRKVPIATATETETQRLARIAAEVRAGRTLDNVRNSVNWIGSTKPPSSVPGPVAPTLAPPTPRAVSRPQQRYYLAQGGDTLASIANRFYGRPDWQRIFNANQHLSNPNMVFSDPVRILIP
jgi:nucleoid-associated protein YgaU